MSLPALDKTQLQLFCIDDDDEDVSYWLQQIPTARLAALELSRRIAYGHDDSLRIQRFLEVTQTKAR